MTFLRILLGNRLSVPLNIDKSKEKRPFKTASILEMVYSLFLPSAGEDPLATEL